jgi:hypothetical protein
MAPERSGGATPATDDYSLCSDRARAAHGLVPEDSADPRPRHDVAPRSGPRANPLVTALERIVLPDPEQARPALAPLLGSLGPVRRPGHSGAAAPRFAPTRPGRAHARGPPPADPLPPKRGAVAGIGDVTGTPRTAHPPRALALIGIGILRWLLVLLFRRASPGSSPEAARFATPEAARIGPRRGRARAVAPEKLAGLEARRRGGTPRGHRRGPFTAPAERRYRAPRRASHGAWR